jgi:hypothetical protein
MIRHENCEMKNIAYKILLDIAVNMLNKICTGLQSPKS